ncbi:MAG TPA: hypothetical protein VF525_07190 [Pyrinomonadaceae bacterium]
MWKLVGVAFGAWVVGLTTTLGWSCLFVETPSRNDVLGFGSLLLGAAVPVCGLLYVPGLFWLRRRLGGCRPVVLFPLAAGVLLNLPVVAVSLFMARLKASMAVGEHTLFIAGFVAMGLTFGLGFVWYCRAQTTRRPLTAVAGSAAR